MITQELVKEMFTYNPETGSLIRRFTVNSRAIKGQDSGTVTKKGYKETSINKKRYYIHRIIHLYVYGYLPENVDHIDGDGLNNKLSNLRGCSPSENSYNKRISSNNTSGVKGVSWCKTNSKWTGFVMVNGKQSNLGYFSSIGDAKAAVMKKREQFHGSFANHG